MEDWNSWCHLRGFQSLMVPTSSDRFRLVGTAKIPAISKRFRRIRPVPTAKHSFRPENVVHPLPSPTICRLISCATLSAAAISTASRMWVYLPVTVPDACPSRAPMVASE